ncbi:exodeoxyribonuclease III [Chondromyces apiculatus]|uniref:Exodeoxyribonuclease III n=1 Tax=Chondromyces apiculatus DSM 436 TaxID=1192034 RepID=A0A017TCH9_9BACT|nr:exodeoxyribonuclease III [Chondromyces apiculatus]EYF06597.1 Exodeoxyribonuclease III [Chondromyces apiculatus DSM 436]
MRIATWNVNSVRTRLEQLTGWLARATPDVVCLQEIKCEDAQYPEEALSEAGYRSAVFGQKTYNGVAILARFGLAIEDVKRNFDTDVADAQRRMIAATVEGVRIINVYVPNGQAVGLPAFAYKLEWLDRLRQEVAAHQKPTEDVLICGDFNVAPEPIDVHDPKRWEGKVLFHPDERAALKRLMDWGLVDAFREKHPEQKQFSWWDYRMGAYRKNQGLRIDLALLSQSLVARCTEVSIDTRPRELDRPSDHAPVVVALGPRP